MSRNWIKSTFITAIMLVLGATALLAQPKYNSPYSRLGFGDPFNQNFTQLNGMGNVAAAFHDFYTLNTLNPASYGHLQFTSFEVGVNARYSSYNSSTGNEGIWSGNLSHLALGFPIKNPLNDILDRKKSKFNWGMAFALIPYTTVGYNVETRGPVMGVDTVSFGFEGSGGSYRILWGNGFKIKKFSFGVNMGFLFGNSTNERTVTFDNLETSYRDILIDEISVNGFVWNAGIQYDYRFMEKGADGTETFTGKFITVGLYGNSPNSFTTNASSLDRRISFEFNDIDTIRNVEEVIGNGRLPSELAIGVMGGKVNKWRAGIDFSLSNWSQYENDAKPESLQNSWRLAIGGEITPNFISYNNYFERVRYRAGIFFGNDPREDSFNEQLTNYGITVGFGLPIILPRQQKSFFNVAFEVGRFGSAESLRETYGRITLGFTLNDDKWFFKRKFN